MKNLFFIFTFLSSINSFGQLPVEFPVKWRNKVICGTANTTGKMNGGSTAFLDFPFKLTISDDGIFAEYNLGEKFGRNEWGETQTINKFDEVSRKPLYDSYNTIYGHEIKYKVPNAYKNSFGEWTASHSITAITLETYVDKTESILSIELLCERYKATKIYSNVLSYQICKSILSKEERRKIEEERLKIENQKKDADKVTIENINQFLNKNALEDLVNEYGKLNFENSAIKSLIQNRLEEKYGNEIITLNFYNVEDYVKSNKNRLKSLNPGKYSISFDKLGNPSNINFPNWPNVPTKEFSSFSVKLNSQTEIEVLVKDSILVSSTYSTSNEKPLYIDKNEKFYFKTKTGLPVATISNNPAVDKKLVRINKVYKREKYANGILIDSQEFKTEKTVGIIKKDQ